jgi:hypothetical protein
MDISKKSYVKTKDLKLGDRITFLNEGEWVKKDFSKTKDGSNVKDCFVLKVNINTDDTEREFNLNATSRDSLGKGWGFETKNWIGQTAVVEFVKMSSFGVIADVLCLKPTRPKSSVQTINPEDIGWRD